MSNKKIYDLEDEIQLLTDVGLRYFTVQEWIKRRPDQLYYHVYRAYRKGLYKHQLSEEAIRLLKKVLNERFPELYTELLMNKARRDSELRRAGINRYSRLVQKKPDEPA